MISVHINGMSVDEFDAFCKEQFGSVPYFQYHSKASYTGLETFYNEIDDDDEHIEIWFHRASSETFIYATVNGEEYEYSTLPFVRSCLF